MADEEQLNDRSEGQPEEVSITKQLGYLSVVRSEAFVEVYANYVSCATSPWDLTIMFARTVADNPDNPRLEQRASVSLSPQTAKAMVHMLFTPRISGVASTPGERGSPAKDGRRPDASPRAGLAVDPGHAPHRATGRPMLSGPTPKAFPAATSAASSASRKDWFMSSCVENARRAKSNCARDCLDQASPSMSRIAKA